MTSQGFVELMLFLAMIVGVWLASYEMLFPTKNKPVPTTEQDNGNDE